MVERRVGWFQRGTATLLIAFWLCFTLTSPAHAGAATYRGFPTVDLYVNGHPVGGDVPAIVLDDRTLVPLRAVAEALGQKVWWDGTLKAVCVGEAPVIADESAGVEPVKRVQEAAAKGWDSIEASLGEAGEIPFTWVFGDRQAWYRHLTGLGVAEDRAAKLAKYAAGCAYDHAEVLAEEGSTLDLTVAHEFVHVLFRRHGLQGAMPRWLNEGIAEYIAREATGYTPSSPRGSVLWDSARQEVLSHALSGTLEDLPATDEQWDDHLGVYPVHDQALLAVDWLVAHSHLDGLFAYLSSLREGKTHEDAFRSAFGLDVQAFPDDFREALRAEAQAALQGSGVRLELDVPEGFSGTLTVFPPGRTESEAWKLAGGRSVTVTLGSDGILKVDLPLAGSGRYTIREAYKDLLALYVTSDTAIAAPRESRVKQLAIAVVKSRFGWYWGGNTAFYEDGSRETNAEDPAFPLGIRLTTVLPLPY
ncbi:MAG: stalk domain-containing protein [Bacillota bacterium]|nr:stalk domain-containing protein [Bacillota bacterium]